MECMEYEYNAIKVKTYIVDCECIERFLYIEPVIKFSDILKKVSEKKYVGCTTITFVFSLLCSCNMDKQLEKLYEAINSNEHLKYVTKIILLCSHLMSNFSSFARPPPLSAIENGTSETHSLEDQNTSQTDEIITIQNDVRFKEKLTKCFKNTNSRNLPPVDNLILIQCESITCGVVDQNNPTMFPFMFFTQLITHGEQKSIQEIVKILKEDWGVIKYKESALGYILYSLTTTTENLYYYNINPALVIIINHMNFEQFTIRSESINDIERLREAFKSKKIPFIILKDGSAEEVKSIMSKVRRFNFTGLKNLYIVVMSHGGKDDIIHTKTDTYNIKDTVFNAIMSNKTLKYTEKFVLINACRGNYDARYDDDDLVTEETDISNHDETISTIYSSQKGAKSYRSKDGAHVVQRFCEEFETPFMNLSINELAETIETKSKLKMGLDSKMTEYCVKPGTSHNFVMKFTNYSEILSTYRELRKTLYDEENENKNN
ncbi:uncharacterized protein LOC119682962 isoform X2 [Teleopsis dalmanni]|uniref:uncharacterized protein LOC119682962 isoform X2 n=1 Tax=Teleopsis dalmanni TaxID=139649 RepID=UPI0018CEBEF4|nr:uncharacterized protein LOC119682962 isoform X2 [Teleopsis dalmanni]